MSSEIKESMLLRNFSRREPRSQLFVIEKRAYTRGEKFIKNSSSLQISLLFYIALNSFIKIAEILDAGIEL